MNIQKILKLHKLWLEGDVKGERANLSGADLRGTDLSRANLAKADLRGTDLSKADLSETDLSRANLYKADLSEANLTGANLTEVELAEVQLRQIKGKDIDTMQFNQHFAYCADGIIKIGCISKPIAEWAEEYERIGKEYKYTTKEIKVYGDWIKSMLD